MEPEKYCKKIVKESGSNFYYSFLFLPRRKRRAIYAIYAFSRIVDDIVDADTDIAFKEKQIIFWRTQIEECFRGKSEHPLTKELIYAVMEFDISEVYLTELINGVTQDMVQNRYATYTDLLKYCYRVASVVGLICMNIFEVDKSEGNLEAATNLGYAFQLTNILRDVGADADDDRIYLPEEDLLKFRVKENDILKKNYSTEFVYLMRFEWERADQMFGKALTGFEKDAERKLLPAMIMADIYYEILKRIKRADYNVFKEKIRVSNPEKIKMAIKRWLKR